MNGHRIGFIGVVAFLAATGTGWASPVELNGSAGDLAGSALFEVVGNELHVTLTNTSTSDVMIPTQVLTALFFDSDITLSLTPVRAVVPGGSEVLFGGTDPGNEVGGEWAYQSGLVGAPEGLTMGISSTGLGLFGPGDRFPGTNLQGTASPDGLQYGITSAGDDPAKGNTPVTGTNALIKHQVLFVFSGVPTNFDPSASIHEVYFLYGTALGEGGFDVPEPSALVLLTLGGVLIGCRERRRS
jgi:hypothetical protein